MNSLDKLKKTKKEFKMKINNVPIIRVRVNKNNNKNLKLKTSKILFWFL